MQIPHLGDAGLAVSKKQGQQRSYDGGLACTHDQLVAQRAARAVCSHESAHQINLHRATPTAHPTSACGSRFQGEILVRLTLLF